MARAHGDAQTVEQRSHVEMVNIAHEEGHNGILLLGLSEETNVGNSTELLHAVTREFLLVRLNVLHAQRLNIVDGCSQSVSSHIVGCTSFKLQGQLLEGSFLPAHLVNHLATALIGRHLL